jgi:tetratricopeptide (TPR) repeat protein
MRSSLTVRAAALLVAASVTFVARANAALPERGSAAHAEALALYHRGAREYELGHFDDAITLLTRAYELSGEPVLQYDLARAYEGKGDLALAVRGYEAFLAGQKDIPDRAAIERRVATVRAQIADRARLEREAADARARAAALRPPAPVHPWPWVVMGAGAAAALVGTGFAVAAEVTHHAATEATTPQLDTANANSRASRWATAATVSFVAGGALAAGGVVYWFVDRRQSSGDRQHEPPAAGVVIAPGFAGVRVRF